MGIFENFPYTNFHELNLDWLLRVVKALSDKVDNLENGNTPVFINIDAGTTVAGTPKSVSADMSVTPVELYTRFNENAAVPVQIKLSADDHVMRVDPKMYQGPTRNSVLLIAEAQQGYGTRPVIYDVIITSITSGVTAVVTQREEE